MAERFREIWERIKADIHRNPGLWIGVGISAVILVIAYLAYRKNQLNTQPLVPANGYGIPNFGTSSGGTDTGLTYPGYSPYQPASPSVPIAPISASFTSPQTAFPAFPAFSLSSAAPSSPFSSFTRTIGQVIDRSAPTTYTVQGSIQNPTATQTAQHLSTAPIVTATSAPIQNPTATQDIAHRGTVYTAPTSYTIPTTIRTQPTYAGRVA